MSPDGEDDWKWYEYHHFYKQKSKNEKAGMSYEDAVEKAGEFVENRRSGKHYGGGTTSSDAKGNSSGAASQSASSGANKSSNVKGNAADGGTSKSTSSGSRK